jgi:hypothetical protein
MSGLVRLAAMMVVTLTAAVATGKEFSGRITYVQRYANPQTGAELKDLGGEPLDREQIYEIDGRNYRSFNEHGRLIQLYRAEENAYYFVRRGEPIKRDAAEEIAPVLGVRQVGETVTVLGRRCRRIDIETSLGTDTFYFDPAGPRVDPTAFRQHALGGWNRYLEGTGGALALKMILRNSAFVVTIEATSIAQASFAVSDFQLVSAMRGRRASSRGPTPARANRLPAR